MPERVIEALRLQKSDVVADVGAGTGYFSRRFARQVAHVYAEDVDPEALSFLRREASIFTEENFRSDPLYGRNYRRKK